jgi:putative acetyltransferase
MNERVTIVMQTQDDITAIEAADIPRTVEVWEASARATHTFLTEADIETLRPLVWQELPHLATLLGMRDTDGQVVGFVGVEENSVEALFIHPAWRGQGIGRQLLSYAVETLGATTLDVNEQNEQAVGFYRHMGFEVAGRSETDGLGHPFPLLHMRYSGSAPRDE